MQKVVVLGAGMVGGVMAADLAADPAFEVTVADIRKDNLDAVHRRVAMLGPRPPQVRTVIADLSNPDEIRALAVKHDLVVGALASRLGYMALETVIRAGRSYCDISFMAEDAIDLDALAKDRGVTCVVDCGVAPGMSNMLAGFEAAQMSPCEHIEIYVGGLPRERRWPFEYKAAFAPSDVLEEYTRPTRLVEHGKVVVRDALTEPELMDLPGVGTLEAVNTDGLRSLARTLKVPFMKEKTLRYPGHYELMRVLRSIGLFSKDPIEINGVQVRPLDVISKLMFPMWTYAPGEEDLTVMRIVNIGMRDGARRRVTWDLLDYYSRDTEATSMARTTALPCTAVARLLASGSLRRPGVNPPELIGPMPGVLDAVLADLEARGVRYTRSETHA